MHGFEPAQLAAVPLGHAPAAQNWSGTREVPEQKAARQSVELALFVHALLTHATQRSLAGTALPGQVASVAQHVRPAPQQIPLLQLADTH